jgi:hypothetical protein
MLLLLFARFVSRNPTFRSRPLSSVSRLDNNRPLPSLAACAAVVTGVMVAGLAGCELGLKFASGSSWLVVVVDALLVELRGKRSCD